MAGEEKKEIVEKVKQIISEQLGVDENEVTPSASFVPPRALARPPCNRTTTTRVPSFKYGVTSSS